MCSHREGEASAPRALGREQKHEMTGSIFRYALPLGRLLTKPSHLEELNASDIRLHIRTSRIPNSGDDGKHSEKALIPPSIGSASSGEKSWEQ